LNIAQAGESTPVDETNAWIGERIMKEAVTQAVNSK
jgi:hypothetical protein